ncbi:MAG: hypothetical protein QM731_20655 [Chitinophagaceae bacterium]
MTSSEKTALKTSLKQYCQSVIEQRIAASKAIINNAQEAANNEEKSSAGDKYETARAMSHLEKDMHTRQLAEHLKDLAALNVIDATILHTEVTTGAYIDCTDISFFIAAGLGKQQVDGKTIWILSPQAPLLKQLLHKKTGDSFTFSNRQAIIADLF